MGRNLMWKTINASVIGTSHIRSEISCQDESISDVLIDANGKEYLVCVVADGAGSAKQGGRGAELACISAMRSAEHAIKNNDIFTTELVSTWIESIRREISAEAKNNTLSNRDYACTLLGVISSENITVLFQIGDGAIILSKNNLMGIVFWPNGGEYANMTYFVTDENIINSLHIEIVESSIDAVAVISDGLQRLALVFDNQTPHVPFFDPMLITLRKLPEDQVDYLAEQLRNYLGSPPVNERTDDDKTLVLATKLN